VLFPCLVVLAASPSVPVNLPAEAAVFVAGQDTVAQSTAGRVEVEFTRALKKMGIALVDVGAVFPPPPAASAEEGDKLFAAGREAYDNLDFEASAKALSEAAVFFIKNPTAARPEQLAEIFLFLGASELQNGAKPAALKEFTRALQMNPSLAPDTTYFGSDVQAAFGAAQKQMGKRPKGGLTVESVPSGAEVEAFGLSYGLTPVAEIELPAGRYLVRLTRPGFAPAAAFPDVQAGKAAEVRQTLQAAPGLITARQNAEKLIGQALGTDALPPGAVELAQSMRSRFLVMLAVTSDAKLAAKVELQVWNVNTGDRLTGVKFDADADGRGYETGAEAVQAFVSRPAPAAVATAPKKLQPSEGDGVLKQWWFWTAVGVVAVGGVTAGVVAAQPRGSGGFNTALGQP